MLVLTRRIGERILIKGPDGSSGSIELTQIKGDRVKLAFNFPPEVHIYREEILFGKLPILVGPEEES